MHSGDRRRCRCLVSTGECGVTERRGLIHSELVMVTVEVHQAVERLFREAGCLGPLKVAKLIDDVELVFVLPPEVVRRLPDHVGL